MTILGLMAIASVIPPNFPSKLDKDLTILQLRINMKMLIKIKNTENKPGRFQTTWNKPNLQNLEQRLIRAMIKISLFLTLFRLHVIPQKIPTALRLHLLQATIEISHSSIPFRRRAVLQKRYKKDTQRKKILGDLERNGISIFLDFLDTR